MVSECFASVERSDDGHCVIRRIGCGMKLSWTAIHRFEPDLNQISVSSISRGLSKHHCIFEVASGNVLKIAPKLKKQVFPISTPFNPQTSKQIQSLIDPSLLAVSSTSGDLSLVSFQLSKHSTQMKKVTRSTSRQLTMPQSSR